IEATRRRPGMEVAPGSARYAAPRTQERLPGRVTSEGATKDRVLDIALRRIEVFDRLLGHVDRFGELIDEVEVVHERVRTQAPVQAVLEVVVGAVEEVVAGLPEEGIQPVVATERVVVVATLQDVRAGAAGEGVVAILAQQAVGAGVPEEVVVPG